jgi:hypothetical protein
VCTFRPSCLRRRTIFQPSSFPTYSTIFKVNTNYNEAFTLSLFRFILLLVASPIFSAALAVSMTLGVAQPEGWTYPQPQTPQTISKDNVDYRAQGGPRLTYLWCEKELSGQSLYLGAEVGCDEKIYCIPGHAPQVLVIDTKTDRVTLMGPKMPGKFKWLRGIRCGEVIYGLPCHADGVLKIHVPTGQVRKLDIPYEQFYADDVELAAAQRQQEWKYHGGTISPLDGCIYCIPQSALHVLKIDPKTDATTLIGPPLPGRYKWYGGVVGKQDGAIYGIPHNSPHVLRIMAPDKITLHGDYGNGGHKWHGASAAPDGTIVSVPANADSVLFVEPADPEPILTEVSNDAIQTGRHRTDGKYKYLGAMTGTDGKVYCFPSGSEYVLQVDTATRTVRNIGPNIFDEQMERICQNKWQNGLTLKHKRMVFAIPLGAESVLQIDCRSENVTTWPLPCPVQGLAKWEGGVVANNGVIYCVPNNFKAVLRIEAPSVDVDPYAKNKPQDEEGLSAFVYKSGIPTLRSSAHRVKFAPFKRTHDPNPKNSDGKETGTTWLPDDVRKEDVLDYDMEKYDFKGALIRLLSRCDSNTVGEFRSTEIVERRLEDFVVAVPSTWREVNGGQCESAQKYLSDFIAEDNEFLDLFDKLLLEVVLPYLKRRLVSSGVVEDKQDVTFYYQRPPTLRLQPGPAWTQVKAHDDAQYGHQNGELNFWLPVTDRNFTNVDLYCETQPGAEDFHPVAALPGQIISFHGSSCKHFVNSNATPFTRVSMDFRVGVEGFFDPFWQMKGTSDDHGRKEVRL